MVARDKGGGEGDRLEVWDGQVHTEVTFKIDYQQERTRGKVNRELCSIL